MKRKSVVLAVVAAALLPLSAAAQIAPDRPARPVDEPVYKWQAYAGLGYTSLNQVNQSRHGLLGATFAVTREWGRYFGLTAQGSFYNWATSSGNPGDPKVSEILAGPELHFPLLDKWNVFGHVLLGGEHTGGAEMTPKVAFAGGGGGGVEYQITPRISTRVWGDAIAASFTLSGANSANAFSPHTTRNPQASVGVAYRF